MNTQTTYLKPGNYTFTTTKAGLHKLCLWGGGQSGENSTLYTGGNGGSAGSYTEADYYFESGIKLNLTVGAGGNGNLTPGNPSIVTLPNMKKLLAEGGGVQIKEYIGNTIIGTSGGCKGPYNAIGSATAGQKYHDGGFTSPGNGGQNTGPLFVGAGGGGGCSWLGGSGGTGGNSFAIKKGTGGSGGGGAGYSNGGEGGYAPIMSPGGTGGDGAIIIYF